VGGGGGGGFWGGGGGEPSLINWGGYPGAVIKKGGGKAHMRKDYRISLTGVPSRREVWRGKASRRGPRSFCKPAEGERLRN